MKHSLSLPMKARKRAISLIEGVLYLVVALTVIIGGVVFFTQANDARKTKDSAVFLSFLSQEATGILKKGSVTERDTTDTFNFLPIERTLKIMDLIPAEYHSVRYEEQQPSQFDIDMAMMFGGPAPEPYQVTFSENISLPFDTVLSPFEISASTTSGKKVPALGFRVNDIPKEACVRLGMKSAEGIGMAGNNIIDVRVEDNGIIDTRDQNWVRGTTLYEAAGGVATDAAALGSACTDGVDLILTYAVNSRPEETIVPNISGSLDDSTHNCVYSDNACTW